MGNMHSKVIHGRYTTMEVEAFRHACTLSGQTPGGVKSPNAFQPHTTIQLIKYVVFLNAAPAGTEKITIMLQTVFF